MPIASCHVEKLLSQELFGMVLFYIDYETQVAVVGDLTDIQKVELDDLLSQFVVLSRHQPLCLILNLMTT